MDWNKYLSEPKYWLVGIGASLIFLHLNLVNQYGNVDFMGSSILFWGAVVFLIWERHEKINLESGIFASFFAATVIALVLLKCLSLSSYDIFLRFSPFISALSIGLLASDFKGLKQYWQELIILGFIAIPPGLPTQFIDLAKITAKFSYFSLWYFGLEVTRQGNYLFLRNGSVEVNEGCSGIHVILQLLGLAIIFLFMFPEIKLKQKIITPMVAVFIAFFVNSIRVALLAILVSNKESFEYWHQGGGSFVFSMIAVMIFGVFCQFAILGKIPENQKSVE